MQISLSPGLREYFDIENQTTVIYMHSFFKKIDKESVTSLTFLIMDC